MNAEFLENNIRVTESEGSYTADIRRKNIGPEGFLGAYVVSETKGAYVVSSAAPNGDNIDITAGPFVISYNPTTAESTVSYSEGGGSANGLIITENESGALDKTWKEIHDALTAGQTAVVLFNTNDLRSTSLIMSTIHDATDTEEVYSVAIAGRTYYAETETGYPSMT